MPVNMKKDVVSVSKNSNILMPKNAKPLPHPLMFPSTERVAGVADDVGHDVSG
jgi:hypothetical protein